MIVFGIAMFAVGVSWFLYDLGLDRGWIRTHFDKDEWRHGKL